MATYNLDPTQTPACVACGSRRTLVVDYYSDSQTLSVRCSACGQRWSVVAGDASIKGGHEPTVRTLADMLPTGTVVR